MFEICHGSGYLHIHIGNFPNFFAIGIFWREDQYQSTSPLIWPRIVFSRKDNR